MITTAVQQGSKMVEIQGAPATIPATGDEFRATLAASVSGSAAQKTAQTPAKSGSTTASGAAVQPGLPSAKHILLAGLLMKTPSPVASGAVQGLLSEKVAGSDESVAAAGTEIASLANLKSASGSSLKVPATGDATAAASSAVADSQLVSVAPAATETPLTAQNSVSTSLRVAAAAWLAVSPQVGKDGAATQSMDGVAVRVRKEPTLASSKEVEAPAAVPIATSLAAGSLHPVAVAIAAVHLDTATVVQVLTPDGPSIAHTIAQTGAKTGVLTSVLKTSDGGGSVHGSPVRPISGGDVPEPAPDLKVPGLNEFASLQQGTFAATVVSAAAGNFSKIASSGAVASDASRASARGGSQSDSIAAEVQTNASEDALATAGSLAGAGTVAAAAPVAIEANLKPLAGAAQTKSVAGNGAGVRPSASIETTAAVTQTRAIAQPHPVSGAQARTPGTVTTQPAGAQAKGSANDAAVPVNFVEATALAGAPAILASGEAKLAPQADVAAVAPPLTEASGRTGIAATKDEKTKPVSAISDGTSAVQSAAQSTSGDTSNVAANITATAAGSANANVAVASTNLDGRVVSAADGMIPATLSATHVAGTPSHDVAISAGSTTTARTLGAVSAGSFPDTASAAAQLGDPHRTLLATPTSLEVGVQSGSQGWLRIRAEVGGPGEVNASLTAASSGAREALHSQLPALNAFLHSEQMSVTTTVSERAALAAGAGQGGTAWGSGGLGSGGLGGDASSGSNASLLQGGGAQGGGGQRDGAQPANVSASEVVRSYDSRGGVGEAAGSLSGSNAISEESGRWLNVRA